MLCRRQHLSDTGDFSQHSDGTGLAGLPHMVSENVDSRKDL